MLKTDNTRSSYVKWSGERIYYTVCIPKWGIVLEVDMPQRAVLSHLACLHPMFTPELHRETAEAYIQNYQVRSVDALAFALMHYDDLNDANQKALCKGINTSLKNAKEWANGWWKHIEVA